VDSIIVIDRFDQYIDYPVAAEGNSEVLIALLTGIVGDRHRLSFQDNLPRFAERVAFQAAAADTANPAAVVGNQHACAGASIGRAPDLDNRGQGRLTRGVVEFPVCFDYTSELFHPLQILCSARLPGVVPS